MFTQNLLLGGVLAPSFVVSAALTEADVDRTVEVVDAAAVVYARALADGVSAHLIGRPVKPTLRADTCESDRPAVVHVVDDVLGEPQTARPRRPRTTKSISRAPVLRFISCARIPGFPRSGKSRG
ncbi:MAG TPA: hypothetical protein PL091_05985 [Actinomycetota bacterium]|nr:hypothetical protein [Actinomycetota bacterium]HRY09873.1 hypothetical protein [Candidatus Nanopelagicales bacterium]